jgi:hypothetical protein
MTMPDRFTAAVMVKDIRDAGWNASVVKARVSDAYLSLVPPLCDDRPQCRVRETDLDDDYWINYVTAIRLHTGEVTAGNGMLFPASEDLTCELDQSIWIIRILSP